jgi:hypothetical protein
MKTILPAFSALLLFASCVPSTPQARIGQFPQKFEALDAKQRALVQQGQIARGMGTDAVYLAWGDPSGIYQGSKNGKATERWDYAGSRPVYVTSYHGAYGYGPGLYGPYGRHGCFDYDLGPDVAYVPYRLATVWFVNKRVDSWERAK